MKDRDAVILLAILAFLFWPKRSVEVGLYQYCQWPDGTCAKVPLGSDCPEGSSFVEFCE